MLRFLFLLILCFFKPKIRTLPLAPDSPPEVDLNLGVENPSILILGGGVAGVIAAKTLKEHNVTNFKIIEARNELGGRLHSENFGEPGRQVVVEVGANWVEGIGGGPGQGPVNPIWTLVQKHGIKTKESIFYDNNITMFDENGSANFTAAFVGYKQAYEDLTVAAGSRVDQNLVDISARTGYRLINVQAETPHEMAVEYYTFDWEFAQTPEQTSLIASSWCNNYTFDVPSGGFSSDQQICIDQHGFKTFIQKEANSLFVPSQVMLNSVVETIRYSEEGVQVILVDGTVTKADYALVSFSLCVLQHGDVIWEPRLPTWKTEAIHKMKMATFTKIFMQFPKKFWFDTQFAVYADRIRGRYPVWQNLDHEDLLPGSGVLVATVTGDWSERIEAMSNDEVQSELMDVLHTMYPDIVDMPEPNSILFHRWLNDPLTRGSFSSWPASFFQEHHDNLRATIGDRLWFTGEHCSQKYYGLLQGAWFEGRDAGQDLVRHIKCGGCTNTTRKHHKQVKNARPYKVHQ